MGNAREQDREPITEPTLSSGDLARRTGTTVRTVRFYEEAGMLKPAAVGKGGRRLYTEAELERLALITDLRELDLSLEEIRDLLRMREDCANAPELAERFATVLMEKLDQTQRRLQALLRLREEFSAALRTLGSCRSCDSTFNADHPCGSCEMVGRDETPRIIKVLVGSPPAESA